MFLSILLDHHRRIHTHNILTEEMRKECMYIYDHLRQGFKREDEHERRDDDMRSKDDIIWKKERYHI